MKEYTMLVAMNTPSVSNHRLFKINFLLYARYPNTLSSGYPLSGYSTCDVKKTFIHHVGLFASPLRVILLIFFFFWYCNPNACGSVRKKNLQTKVRLIT